MLSLSTLWILITLGGVLFWYAYRVHSVAKNSNPSFKSPIWIVFGKQLKNNQPDDEYRQRLDRTFEMLGQQPPKHLVLQGGVTSGNSISESEVGRAYLASKMAESNNRFGSCYNVILEDRSRNTLENLKNSRDYLANNQLPLQVGLITNRYHLLRCAVMAESLGFKTQYIPAEKSWSLNREQLYKVIQEAFLLNWFIIGKRVSYLLKNRRMIDKIS